MPKKVTLYVVHPDRTVSRHGAKVNLPDYLDTKEGRWLLRPQNIFHGKPVADFETWDEFEAWKPLVQPPKAPSALAIEGDIMPQSPERLSDAELADALNRTPIAAAQDLMTAVGTEDSKRSALVWAMAAVMGVCGLAILFMIIVAAAAFLGGDDPAPVQPIPAPGAPGTVPPPAATPWPFPTVQAAPTPVEPTPAAPPPTPRPASSQPRSATVLGGFCSKKRRKLLVYDEAEENPYMVTLPFDELHTRPLAVMRMGGTEMFACRRDSNGIRPLDIEQDSRTHKTPEYLATLRAWNRQMGKPTALLLVYDAGLPEQPYVVSLPSAELRARFTSRQELRLGKKSMWACRRNAEGIRPLEIKRDSRTNRTPEYVAEYMKLRADKENVANPATRTEKFMMMGAAVGICVTTVSGLILVMALST